MQNKEAPPELDAILTGQNHTSARSASVHPTSTLKRDAGDIEGLGRGVGDQNEGHEPGYKKVKTEKDDDR